MATDQPKPAADTATPAPQDGAAQARAKAKADLAATNSNKVETAHEAPADQLTPAAGTTTPRERQWVTTEPPAQELAQVDGSAPRPNDAQAGPDQLRGEQDHAAAASGDHRSADGVADVPPRAQHKAALAFDGSDGTLASDNVGAVYYRAHVEDVIKPYVGKFDKAERWEPRQAEEKRQYGEAGAGFRFLRIRLTGDSDKLLGSRVEQQMIQEGGGPSTRRNPDGALANKRNEMSESRYEAAGGPISEEDGFQRWYAWVEEREDRHLAALKKEKEQLSMEEEEGRPGT